MKILLSKYFKIRCIQIELLLLLIIVCWSSRSSAQSSAQFFFEGYLHWAAVNGHVQWSDSNLIGSTIDLEGALGLQHSPAFSGKFGVVLHDRHEVLFGFQRYHFSEDTTLNASIDFGGITIPAGIPLSPELTFQTFGLFYGYRLLRTDTGFLSIRPGFMFINYDVSVSSTILGVRIGPLSYSNDDITPGFVVAGEYWLHPRIAIAGEFSGGYWKTRAGYLFQPELKFLLHSNIRALLGYSHLWFREQFDDKDDLFEVTLSGPIFGVEVVW